MSKTLPNLSKPDTTLTVYLFMLPLTAMVFGLLCVIVVPLLAMKYIWQNMDNISIYSHLGDVIQEPINDRSRKTQTQTRK